MSNEEGESVAVVDSGLWHPVVPAAAVALYVAVTVWATLDAEVASVKNDIETVGNPGFQIVEVGLIVLVLAAAVSVTNFLTDSDDAG